MDSKFQLSYEKGTRCGDERYSIAIPDNFNLEKGAEGRAFIAWYPEDAANHFLADITLFDGKIAGENEVDSRLFSTEVCAAYAECVFWDTPSYFRMYKDAKFIPLAEDYPAGGICAAYDPCSFQYLAYIVLKGCIKVMRVEVGNVTEKDIPACDQMVIDWVKTMKISEPMDPLKKLNDPCFTTGKLTQEVLDEWNSCAQIYHARVVQTLQYQSASGSLKYAHNLEYKKSNAGIKADYQRCVNNAAIATSAWLLEALDGLEAISKNNPGNPLLEKLCHIIYETVMTNDSVVLGDAAGVKGTISAKLPYYEEIKSRYLKLISGTGDAQEEIVADSNFVNPTYKKNKIVHGRTLMFAIPDYMSLAAESKSKTKSTEENLDTLEKTYSLLAVSSDYAPGFDDFVNAPLCINLSWPQQIPKFEMLFDKKALKAAGIELDLVSNLVSIAKQILEQGGKFNQDFPIEYVCGDDNYGIVLTQTEQNAGPKKNRNHYMFIIFHKSNIYQGNVYINAKGNQEDFLSAVKEWLIKIVPAENNY